MINLKTMTHGLIIFPWTILYLWYACSQNHVQYIDYIYNDHKNQKLKFCGKYPQTLFYVVPGNEAKLQMFGKNQNKYENLCRKKWWDLSCEMWSTTRKHFSLQARGQQIVVVTRFVHVNPLTYYSRLPLI